MAKSVSLLRPNRKYDVTFKWSEELNKDLCDADLASERERPGFMKRLKSVWDAKHPEHNFSAKLLNERAKRLRSKSDKRCATIECQSSPGGETNFAPQQDTSCELETVDAQVRDLWEKNWICISNLSVNERPYTTKLRKRPSEAQLHMIEILAQNQLLQVKAKSGKLTLQDINSIIYVAAVTTQMMLNDSQPKRRLAAGARKPGWVVQLDERVAALRRKVAQLTVVLDCKEKNLYTKHQKTLLLKFKKQFGNTQIRTLNFKLHQAKQTLKATSGRLRYEKNQMERKKINRWFASDPKAVYRQMRGNEISAKQVPTKEEVEDFWENVWGTKTATNANPEWLADVRRTYCTKATESEYQVNDRVIEDQLSRLSNNKAPGPDMIVGFWYKNLRFYRTHLREILQECFSGISALPSWLGIARTQLVPKCPETHLPNNYRPIACQNIMLKIYTGCLNTFLQDHCTKNNIVTPEQAGAKKGVWGCAEHLLINKMVQDEVKLHRRNLLCVWLDYQKAFDSVPHDWMIEALKLAKVPQTLIKSIEALPSIWATRVHLRGGETNMESKLINYSRGIFQGDSLSVLLFVLTMNPLSHLLQRMKGYRLGPPGHRDTNLSHLFFIDDLKLFAPNMETMKELLKTVTTFSSDIGMQFGLRKCSYVDVKLGEAVTSQTVIELNGVKILPLGHGETYRYLGIDECVTYNGPLNKERVASEYLKRLKRIWTSELSGQNKCIAHNSFAVPVLTPTFGILQWSIDDLESLDIKSRKLLTSTGNFHRNGDVDRLYLPRNDGGRGLKSIYGSFTSRIVALHHHVVTASNDNIYLKKLVQHEKNGLCRIAVQLSESLGISSEPSFTPRALGRLMTSALAKKKKESFQGKVMHGYVSREMHKKPDVDIPASLSWYKNRTMSSEFEAYANAIEEQEIASKYLLSKRNADQASRLPTNNRCRLCVSAIEDTSHIIAGCDKMAARYYTPLRHDAVARFIWNAIRRKDNAGRTSDKEDRLADEFIDSTGPREYWWNLPIQTCTKVKHNRPDIVSWNHQEKQCSIIEIACPLDVNIVAKEREKEIIYGPLIRNLQMMYPAYKFRFVPIVVGANGFVTKALSQHVKSLGFADREVPFIIRRLQVLSVSGTVKITKTFVKFRT